MSDTKILWTPYIIGPQTSFINVAAAGAPSYVFLNSAQDAATNANPTTCSITIPADAQLIVVCTVGRVADAVTAISINGQALTQDTNVVDPGILDVSLWSIATAVCGTGVQTISVSWASIFIYRDIYAWSLKGLSSTLKKAVATPHNSNGTNESPPVSTTLSVDAGDLVFAMGQLQQNRTLTNFTGSTETPTGTQAISSNDAAMSEWVIASTNASFSFVLSWTGAAIDAVIIAASYR